MACPAPRVGRRVSDALTVPCASIARASAGRSTRSWRSGWGCHFVYNLVCICASPPLRVLAFFAHAITKTKRHELLAALQTRPHLLDVLGISGGNLGTTVRRAILLARLKARVIHVVSTYKSQPAELDQGKPGCNFVRIARWPGRANPRGIPPRPGSSFGSIGAGP